MNKTLHVSAVALGALGVALLLWGRRQIMRPLDIHCGDKTCEEAHP